jgi:hypothetical protein
MVKIIDYKVRMSADGEPFFALILQGGIQLVQSKETGMFYATAKRASITSTFDEETCKSLIGQELDGTVEKVECETYEYTNEETGEILELSHRWVFVKEGETVGEVDHQEQHEEEPELV